MDQPFEMVRGLIGQALTYPYLNPSIETGRCFSSDGATALTRRSAASVASSALPEMQYCLGTELPIRGISLHRYGFLYLIPTFCVRRTLTGPHPQDP